MKQMLSDVQFAEIIKNSNWKKYNMKIVAEWDPFILG